MNFDKEFKSRNFFIYFFVVGGGGGNMAGDMYMRAAIFVIHDTMSRPTHSTTELYSLVKIFLMVFKIEGIVALTIKGI